MAGQTMGPGIYKKVTLNVGKMVTNTFRQHFQNTEPSKISRSSYLRRIRQLIPFKLGVPNCRPNFNAQPPWSILAQWVFNQRMFSLIFNYSVLL